MTNREWLNSLSDEELAKIIMPLPLCTRCKRCFDANSMDVLNWLKANKEEK